MSGRLDFAAREALRLLRSDAYMHDAPEVAQLEAALSPVPEESSVLSCPDCGATSASPCPGTVRPVANCEWKTREEALGPGRYAAMIASNKMVSGPYGEDELAELFAALTPDAPVKKPVPVTALPPLLVRFKATEGFDLYVNPHMVHHLNRVKDKDGVCLYMLPTFGSGGHYSTTTWERIFVKGDLDEVAARLQGAE